MNFNNVKIKYINENEFLLYIDWLTRFKNPIDNLLRVCDKVILKNLLSPKFSAKKLQELDIYEKIEISKYIWYSSLENLLGKIPFNSSKLKDFLIYEESKTFNTNLIIEYLNSLSDEKKISLNADYKKVRSEFFLQIDELVEYFEDIADNYPYLQRLISKKNSDDDAEILFHSVCEFSSIKLLFLVEGITEEKLFPAFSKINAMDFSRYGIKLKSAGGKTHLLKYYAKVRKLLKIPVFILLDADGKDVIDELNNILEDKDKVYLIQKGEIEDILPHALIIKALNNFYSIEGSISEIDLTKNESMAKILYNLYKEKGFGEFQKAKFAQIIEENLTSVDDIQGEIKDILDKLKNLI